MTPFNDSKIIQEAKEVIATIELALQRQAGFKIGDASTHLNTLPPEKQAKIDKLNSLVHYTCYLEKQNDEYFCKFSDLQERIKMLNSHINNLQLQANVDKKIREL